MAKEKEMLKDHLQKFMAFLFDFEGTLVDPQWNLKEGVKETIEMLRRLGFPIEELRDKKYSALMGEAMKMASHHGHSPVDVRNKIGEIYDRYDEDALSRWMLRPNAKELLFTLKTKGVKTGLVSNGGKRTLRKALSKLDIENLFEVVVSRNDVQNLKPSGEGLRLALNKLQVKKDRTLYVGDSVDDIGAAKEAGLKVLIILGGENPKTELLAANPDFLIQSYGELLAYLNK